MSKKLTIKDFITRAQKVHNNKYLYGTIKYINNSTNIEIVCPIHGKFEQTPKSHLKGSNCPTCAERKLTTSKFIEKAKLVHGNKYNYDNVEYKGATVKVNILCYIHGNFTQKASSHLEGTGCIKCRNAVYRSTTEEFIQKATKIHGSKYDYSKVVYGNTAADKISIICKEHGEFKQIASDHLGGSGCSSCISYGFDKSKSAYLYYLKITTNEEKILYKIGVTNRTVNERFSLIDLNKIEIVKQKLYEKGQEAYDWEQKILNMYKKYKYKGPKILDSGNTELFTENVMALYYAKKV